MGWWSHKPCLVNWNVTHCRFNNYGPDRRHMSCHFKKTAPYKLKPIKRAIMKRAMEMQKQTLLKQQLEEEEGKREASTLYQARSSRGGTFISLKSFGGLGLRTQEEFNTQPGVTCLYTLLNYGPVNLCELSPQNTNTSISTWGYPKSLSIKTVPHTWQRSVCRIIMAATQSTNWVDWIIEILTSVIIVTFIV